MNEGGITMRRRRPFWTAAFLCYRKEKEAVEIRRFKETDAQEVSALIAKTLRTTNAKDYSSEFIENEVKVLTPEYIAWRASWTHFYVACEGDTIVGCGAIGPYWGSETESSLFTIFVLPEYRGKGIAQTLLAHIIRTLRAENCTLLGVDCETFNPTAINFWSKNFAPYTYSVVRCIDENAVL